MDKKSKYEGKLLAVALSADGFTTGYLYMCLLFFVPYAVRGGLVGWFMPIACIVPFAVMPLVYTLIHRLDTLLFGRYHFFMPLSALIAALFFVLMWTPSTGAAKSCLIFFGALIFVCFDTVYRYCAFSVRARLSGMGLVTKSVQYEVIAAVGAIAAFSCLFGFLRYDPQNIYSDTAYVIAGACIICAITQYLVTAYGIPRLGGKRNYSIKYVFKSFYDGLDKKIYFSALLIAAAFASIASLLVLAAYNSFAEQVYAIAAGACAAGGFTLGAIVCARVIRRRTGVISIVNTVLTVISVGVGLIPVAAGMSGKALGICICLAAVVAGMGGAMALRQTKLRFLTVKPQLTAGVLFMLYELTVFGAFAFAFAVAAVVCAIPYTFSAAIGGGIAVVFAVVSVSLGCRKNPKPPVTDAPITEAAKP